MKRVFIHCHFRSSAQALTLATASVLLVCVLSSAAAAVYAQASPTPEERGGSSAEIEATTKFLSKQGQEAQPEDAVVVIRAVETKPFYPALVGAIALFALNTILYFAFPASAAPGAGGEAAKPAAHGPPKLSLRNSRNLYTERGVVRVEVPKKARKRRKPLPAHDDVEFAEKIL
ncbi:MAG: hypothetical protein LBR44_03935 [Clostridiales Family XIII bacterium]|jgi:hypothetical protein|nr:hypothetical protein [Clostridiales Family XIII bacterium]